MTRRIYIAGPMTSVEHYNAPAFDAAAFDWRQRGWAVVTPLQASSIVWQRHHGRAFDPRADRCEYGDPLIREMFVEDVALLLASDAIALLPGWEASRGARIELQLALLFGLDTYLANGTRIDVSLTPTIRQVGAVSVALYAEAGATA